MSALDCLNCKSLFNLWQCENCKLAFYCSECLVKLVSKNKAQCPSCQGIDWKMIRETFPSIPVQKEHLEEIYCRNCKRLTLIDPRTDSGKERLCNNCFLYWHFKGAFG